MRAIFFSRYNHALWLFPLVAVVITWSAATAANANAARLASIEAREQAVAAARQQAEAWRHHLERLAWDKAHPAELAKRRAKALAKIAQQQAAQRAEAAREAAEAYANEYHGYVIAHDTDFWETDSYMCNGFVQAAQDIVNGDEVDVNSIPGRHNITQGTRVTVVGHKSGYCPGSDVEMNLTEIVVHDGNSSVDGMDGYIQEGLLAQE